MPKHLRVVAFLTSSLYVASCGGAPTPSSRPEDSPSRAPAKPLFSDINPTLETRCSPCHNNPIFVLLPQFVGNQSVFDANADKIKNAITTNNPLAKMPPAFSSGGPLSPDELTKILAYLGQ